MNYQQRFYHDFYQRKFHLGTIYDLTLFGRKFPGCVFVRVTPKGFNFINPETDTAVLRKHLYCRDFSHKKIPSDKDLAKMDLSFKVSNGLTAKTSDVQQVTFGDKEKDVV